MLSTAVLCAELVPRECPGHGVGLVQGHSFSWWGGYAELEVAFTGLLWSWIGPTSPGRTTLEEKVLLQSHTVLGGRWMWECWFGCCQLFPQWWGPVVA